MLRLRCALLASCFLGLRYESEADEKALIASAYAYRASLCPVMHPLN